MISLGRRSVALLAAASLLLGGCASEDGGDTWEELTALPAMPGMPVPAAIVEAPPATN